MTIIVSSCPRSGTKYTAKVFQRVGLRVGHERIGRDGVVSWYSTILPPFTSTVQRWHQIREPLATIGSLLTITNASFRLLRHVIDFQNAPTKTAKCCAIYIGLHAAGCNAGEAFRIEDAETVFPEIFESVQIETTRQQWAGIATNTNTRQHKTMTWQRIENDAPHSYDQLRKFASEWGYSA